MCESHNSIVPLYFTKERPRLSIVSYSQLIASVNFTFSKKRTCLRSILRLIFAARVGKIRRKHFYFMATASDLRVAWRSITTATFRRPRFPAPHARQPARVRAGHAAQHQDRQGVRRALQLDGKNRAGADDDDENGVQLQGRLRISSSRTRKITRRSRSRRNWSADAKNYLVENAPVDGCVRRGEARVRRNSPSVILTVADAPEGVRGDSATTCRRPSRWKPNHGASAAVHQSG